MSLKGRIHAPANSAPLSSRCSSALRGQALPSCNSRCVTARATFQVVAKQNSLKRERTSEKARQYNKSHKSAVATRMKKVFSAVDGFMTELPSSEDAIKPVEKLISEAYQEIDKAVGKGVLHINTGARRKAKLAAAKRHLLTEAGLYTPQ
ncbi:hypothetical protein ABBQ32_008958 [Trebouxia sp. C0010 RCD-2024]